MQKICQRNSQKELLTKEFTLKNDGLSKDAFLIYFKRHFYAYENSCPHTGVTLNWQEGQFFSHDGLFIQCSLHGALFEPNTGVCIRGPCLGDCLKSINIEVTDDAIYITDD